MLKITIAAVGKIKVRHFKDACDEYLKRLKPLAKIQIVELEPEPFKSDFDKIRAKDKEGERVMKFLAKYSNSQVVILDENGINLSSQKFADFSEKYPGEMVFVIGGVLGFNREILEKYKTKISLSKMTFPHELARVILCEQIYRAVTITKGMKYHY